MRRVHKEQIWDPVVPRATADRPPPRPDPDPRAARTTRARSSWPSTRRRSARRPAPPAARGAVDGRHVPLLVREPRARAPRRADRPGGVPRRRAHLAVPRGHGPRPRVRAGRRPRSSTRTSRPRSRATSTASRRSCAPPATPGAADHAGSPAASCRPSTSRSGPCRCSRPARPAASWARRSRPPRSASTTSSRSTWAARASTCASSAAAQPEIKTDWNWRYRYYLGLPMVDVQSVGAGGGSIARVRQGALLVGPESAGSAPGPGLLRPGRRRPDGHRRRRGARLPARRPASRAAACGSTSTRPAPRITRDVAEPARDRPGRRGVGHRADRQRQHGQRHPPGAGVARRRRPHPRDDRLRRQRAGARLGGRPRARHRPGPGPEGRAGVLARSACSSPTTSSTSSARTSCPLSQVELERRPDADGRAARRGRQGARPDGPGRAPTSSSACSPRWRTRARTST